MFTWINSANIYQTAPVVYNVTYSEDLEFIRPELSKQADPYVVLREADFSEGKLPQSLPWLKDVVNASKNETGTLLSAVYTDPSNSTRLFKVEASMTKEYFLDVHSKSEAYLIAQSRSWAAEIGAESVYLKMMGGFLYKGK
jgi:quinol monooxygenase YgiN